jgi:uncharacterized protein
MAALLAADRVIQFIWLKLKTLMLNKVARSPILARMIPFLAFAALTLIQGSFGDAAQYWIYALKTAIGAWLLYLMRTNIKEMRWVLSWESIVVGIGVFAIWVGLDGRYPLFAQRPDSFNPKLTFGAGSASALLFIAMRLIGSSLVVPFVEEVFYRSFLYRFIINTNFLKIPLGHLNWGAFFITGVIFGVSHYEWLPGILCALAYQGLVCRKNRLGDAITAHAITNFLLGLWVITRNAYYFW